MHGRLLQQNSDPLKRTLADRIRRPRCYSGKLKLDWRYALSELVIVVVGVLIALGAEGWLADMGLRRAESESLTRVANDMTVDLDDIGGNLARTERGYDAARWLMEHRNGPPPSADSLSDRLTHFTGCSILSSNTSEYTALKSSGQLANLRDLDFRQRLVDHYEAYPYLAALCDLDCRTMEEAIAAIESDVAFDIDPTFELWPTVVIGEPQNVLRDATFQRAVAYAAQIRALLTSTQQDALVELRALRDRATELAAR